MNSQDTGTFKTGDGRDITVNAIADLYRDGLSLSSPYSGRIFQLGKDNYSLSCQFSTVDCDNLESIKTSKSYSLVKSQTPDKQIESVRCISNPQLVGEIAVVTSENGRYLARLKESAKDQDNKRQYLELWDRSKLLKTIDINELEEHGPINVDEYFSFMSWCPYGDQDKLLYVCQSKKPKFQSFFKQQVKEGKIRNLGDDYSKIEDWGECLEGISHTMAAVIDITSLKITTYNLDGHSLADSRWLDGGNKIVSTAIKETPKRLGLVYCNNRPCKILIHELNDASSFDIHIKSQSLHSPRVSHCGQKLLYLKSPLFGAHHHSVSLCLYDLKTGSSVELASDLFVTLPERCFSMDDKYVLFLNENYLHNEMSVINLESRQLSKIKFPTTGVNILDFNHDIILASGSKIDTTPTLYVAILTTPDLVAWHQIEDCIHVDEISYQIYKVDAPDGQDFISAVLVSPNLQTLYKKYKLGDVQKQESELPTIVNVHGGPHSCYLAFYMPTLVLYARLGIKSLLINYRGSTGVSENYLRRLCGKIGSIDVGDCLHVIRHLAKNRAIDPKKLVIHGGSHGGFLACHLSCQDEFKFTSAIIRNPVVDLVSMYSTSDIPDWINSAALGHDEFDFTWLPTKEELAKLYDSSPISRVSKAYVPTLMFIGNKDKRVRMFQGERWIDHLAARGVETKCKVYADKHALSKTEVSADSVITAIIWMLRHL